jgi:hypothetical protein
MSTALKQMAVDEFLSRAEGREGRWELHDGVPVTAGLPCEVFTDGMAMRIDARTA